MDRHRSDLPTDYIGLASRGAEARPSVPSQTRRLHPPDSNGRGVPAGHTAGYVGQPLPMHVPVTRTPVSTSAAPVPQFFFGSVSSLSCATILHPHFAAKVSPDTHIRTTWSQPRASNSDVDASEAASDGQSRRFYAVSGSSTGLGSSLSMRRLPGEDRWR